MRLNSIKKHNIMYVSSSGSLKLLLLFLFIQNISQLHALDDTEEYKSKWEIGVGIGALSVPHYRGSDQRSEYALPIPYLRYNGKKLKVDREGGRFYLYEGEKMSIDISSAFSLPVDSDDNRAREGMPDLDYVIELGPRLQVNLYTSADENFRFRFYLPLRAAFATDLHSVEYIGVTVTPFLQGRYHYNGWENALAIGPMWGSEKYHDYFYEVESKYSNLNRAKYDAQAGYSGSRITYTVSKRYEKVFVGLFTRYDNLRGASFQDSPLFKKNDSFMFGIALSWVFKSSKSKVLK